MREKRTSFQWVSKAWCSTSRIENASQRLQWIQQDQGEGLQEAINKIIELKKEQGEEVVEKIHEPKSDENSSANNEENNSSSEGASDFTNVDFDDI